MKALLSIEPGPPASLELKEIPSPAPGAGELRVRVEACSINYPDTLTIVDQYQIRPPRPFSPGSEYCGTVDAVGEGVEGWSVGDRLIGLYHSGGLAEQAIVPAMNAIPLPEDKDALEAASLIMTYGTTIHALVDRGELKSGETLLVLGAAGGVGLAAVQIGKALGARVVAAVSSEEKATAAREAGADEVVIYAHGPFDKDQSKALANSFKEAVGPKGADVIYDPVGGDYAEPALRSIAWMGRYLVIGFPSGIPRMPLNLLLLKSSDVRGVFWGAFMQRDPKRNAAHVQQLFRWWSEGKIKPKIDKVYSLDDGAAAIERLTSRSAIGKVVVVPSKES